MSDTIQILTDSLIQDLNYMPDRMLENRFLSDSYELDNPESYENLILSLSPDEYEHLLDSLFVQMLALYLPSLNISFLTHRLITISTFLYNVYSFKDAESRPTSFCSGYLMYFKHMSKYVDNTEHSIMWSYWFEQLSQGYLDPDLYNELFINDFLKFGQQMLSCSLDDLEWWLPLYCDLDIFKSDKGTNMLKGLLRIPDKYMTAYRALNLGLAEVYIHYKKTAQMESIIHGLENVKFVS